MAEETTTVRSTVINMDEQLSNVMPDSWEGFARLEIRKSEVVPQKNEEKAIEKSLEIAENVGVTPQKAAQNLVEKLDKRLD